MTENERIIKIAIGSKIRVATKVADSLKGAMWIYTQITALHLDPHSVEFGHELGTYGAPVPEAWLEGYVTAETAVSLQADEFAVMPC